MNAKIKSLCMLVVVLLVGTTQAQFDYAVEPADDYNEVLDILKKEFIKGEDVAKLKARDYIATYAESDKLISEMVKGLNNRWTTYSPASAFASYDASKVNAGVYVTRSEKGELIADLVIFDSPAYKAGLRHGDEMIAIDGQPLDKLTETEVQELLRRTPGKRATLRYKGIDGVTYCRRLRFEKEPDAVVAELLPGNVAYFHIRDFTTTGMLESFSYQAAALDCEADGKIRGVILDVRGNTGGYLYQCWALASAFIEKGVVGILKDKDGKETKVEAAPFMLKVLGDGRDNRRLVQSFYKLPVVLLVDGSTMSAAEGITASLKDSGRAQVIGTKTWGKAMYFYSHNLTNGGWLTVTGGKFYGPKGVDHHGVGITPDLVKPVWREGEDLVLNAALTEIGKTKPIRVKPETVPQVPSLKPQPQPDYWLMVGLNICLGLAVLGVLLLAAHGLGTGSRRRSLPDFVWDPVSEQFVAGRLLAGECAAEESDEIEIPEVIVLDDYSVVEDVPPLLSSYDLQPQNFYVGSACCGCGKELVGGEPVVEALSYSGPSFYCQQCNVAEPLLESR